MMQKQLQEFMDTCYETQRERFLDEIQEFLHSHEEEVANEVQKGLENFIRAVSYGQEQFPAPVECIHISLLDTSFYKECPAIRFDAYGEMGVLGLRLFSKNYPFLYFKEEWLAFKKRLQQDVVDRKAVRYISEARIQQMMLEALEMVHILLYAAVKYYLYSMQLDTLSAELIRKENFYISFGSYMDRQTIVCTDYPEVDIFFHKKEETLDRRKYKNKVYRKKEFTELHLEQSKFVACQFVNCKFAQCNLKDVVFENCRFYSTEFAQCDGAGMTITNGILENVVFENVAFYNDVEENQSLKGIYKPLDMVFSQAKKVKMKNCDLSYARFLENYEIEIQMSNCNLKGSTMEEEVDADGIFQIMPEQEDE